MFKKSEMAYTVVTQITVNGIPKPGDNPVFSKVPYTLQLRKYKEDMYIVVCIDHRKKRKICGKYKTLISAKNALSHYMKEAMKGKLFVKTCTECKAYFTHMGNKCDECLFQFDFDDFANGKSAKITTLTGRVINLYRPRT
jgi:hypothetical protein